MRAAVCPRRRAQPSSLHSIVLNESTVSILADQRSTAGQPTLSMLGITKHYDGVAALTDVTYEVLPGEVHALLGENGAGQSTLMNIASGATSPDSGTIVVDGFETESLTPASARDLGIAMVHQHPAREIQESEMDAWAKLRIGWRAMRASK